MQVRRVATGIDARGKSVFVSDELVDPITIGLSPGYEFHRLWGSDSVPELPSDGSPPPQPQYFPPAGGYRIGFFTVPAASQSQGLAADFDIGAGIEEMNRLLPGMADHMEPGEPGMHTTDTVDFELVVSGEVVCELDDGAETTLRAGDVFVQNGTRHRWSNRGTEPAVIFVVLIGANRA